MLNAQLLSILSLWLGVYVALARDSPRKHGTESHSNEFVVQIKQMRMDLQPHGGTASTCVLVLPDSKIHVEKRVQHLPESAAKLSISESKLTPDQMQQLRNILAADQIKALPHFEFKKEYAGDDGFDGYQATIMRDKRVQVVGYANPIGRTNPDAEPFKEQWANAQHALQPLVSWVDEIAASLPPGRGRSSFCDIKNSPN